MRYCKKNSAFNSLFSDLSEKTKKQKNKKIGKFKKFKIYVKMMSANMTS